MVQKVTSRWWAYRAHAASRAGAADLGLVKWSTNDEALQALWSLELDLDAGDPRVGRSLATPFDQVVNGLGVAFDHDFDPTIRKVARPA
jgi:hypothetical protein